jgi:hypothetical protein
MNTRDVLPVSINQVMLLSSDTSTAVVTAVDLANYFPVGKREVIFTCAFVPSSTSLGIAATVVVEQSDSTSTTSFVAVNNAAGSALSFSHSANAVASLNTLYGVVNSRYVRTRYVGATSTGGTIALSVNVLPIVRAA